MMDWTSTAVAHKDHPVPNQLEGMNREADIAVMGTGLVRRLGRTAPDVHSVGLVFVDNLSESI